MRLYLIILTCLLGFHSLGQIGHAQTDTPVLDTPIALETDAANDAAITARLEGIFVQIESLSGVRAATSQGVVRLSGSAANDEAAERALSQARRVDGVVAVEDGIARTLDVADNVAPVVQRYCDWLTSLINALPLIAVALAGLVVLSVLGNWIAKRHTFWDRVAPNPFLGQIFAQIARIVFVVGGLILALNILGAGGAVAAILGSAGVIGLAVGFAVRDTLENYIASVLLSVRQPFRAGDLIRVDDQYEGNVVRLTSRATVLMTPDGNQLRIPNATVFKSTILNFTTNPQRRFSFTLGVDGADDPVAAMELGWRTLDGLPFVLDAPGPLTLIENVGDSSIVLKFMGWVDQGESDFNKARSLAIRAVKDVIEAEGFTLPEPIYRVNLRTLEGGSAPAAQNTPKAAPATSTVAQDVRPESPSAELACEAQAEGDTNLLSGEVARE